MIVRKAKAEEGPEVLDLLRAMYASAKFWPPAWDDIQAKLVEVMTRGWALVAVDDDGRLVGTLGLERRRIAWYSREPVIGEVWTYSAGNGAGTALIAEAKRISKSLGLPLLASEWSQQDGPRKWAWFGRLMKKIGEIYLVEP